MALLTNINEYGVVRYYILLLFFTVFPIMKYTLPGHNYRKRVGSTAGRLQRTDKNTDVHLVNLILVSNELKIKTVLIFSSRLNTN